jgi:hypothetical protein
MQAAKENLSRLVSIVGQELADAASARTGMASARAVAMAITRFFGADRFDICSWRGGNWVVAFSSEIEAESRELHTSYDFQAGPSAGIIEANKLPPFAEFSEGRAYSYASLFVGREWLFLRHEGRRRASADLELLTDSFKIIYGLFSKFQAMTRQILMARETRKSVESRRQTWEVSQVQRPEVLTGLANDLDRLVRQFSDLKQDPELRELFMWLESIQKAAKNGARLGVKAQQHEFAEPKSREPSPGLDEIIKKVVDTVSSTGESRMKIEYELTENPPIPDIPPERLQKSLIEFFSAALLNIDSNGSLKLTASGDKKAIIFELHANKLAEPPKHADRPAWLSRIDGRIESRTAELEDGETRATWRLTIPVDNRVSDAHTSPLKILAIDSQDIIRDLLTSMLTNLGHEHRVVGKVDNSV